jgi:hypothetical protein
MRIVLLLGLCAALAAQTPPLSVLEIEVENSVVYWEDNPDLSKWGKSAAIVPFVQNFPNTALKSRVMLGDIVAVNGTPVKGLFQGVVRNFTGSLDLVPGRAIGDVPGCLLDLRYVILDADGALLGSIVVAGNNAALALPGAPSAMPAGVYAVVGGTGVFLGAKGQMAGRGSIRNASIAEDPAYRRVNGGGNLTYLLQLVPMTWPEVVMTPGGPAVYHLSDFSQVTAASPARPGEQLIVSVSGLGPVKPNLDPGLSFPPFQQGKLHEIVSPVSVQVNGKAAVVPNKVGWPGMTDVYRVDFVVPDGLKSGPATIRVSAGWINGREFSIPVR